MICCFYGTRNSTKDKAQAGFKFGYSPIDNMFALQELPNILINLVAYFMFYIFLETI